MHRHRNVRYTRSGRAVCACSTQIGRERAFVACFRGTCTASRENTDDSCTRVQLVLSRPYVKRVHARAACSVEREMAQRFFWKRVVCVNELNVAKEKCCVDGRDMDITRRWILVYFIGFCPMGVANPSLQQIPIKTSNVEIPKGSCNCYTVSIHYFLSRQLRTRP